MSGEPLHIRSRDNPSLVRVRRALRDPGAYRRDSGLLWLEGDHLLRAGVARGVALRQVLVTEAAWSQPALRALAQQGARVLVLPDDLFGELSTLPSPAAIGALVEQHGGHVAAQQRGRRPAAQLEAQRVDLHWCGGGCFGRGGQAGFIQ